MLQNFTWFALPGLLLIGMGIKAMTPAGIQLTEIRKLSRRTSAIIGTVTLILGVTTVGTGFYITIFRYL